MGISGLLKGLKSYTRKGSVRDFSGKTLAVDASSWLHKSVYSIAEHYVEAFERGVIDDHCINTSANYIFKRCQELFQLDHISCICLVMDGKRCPLKAITNQDREHRRRANLAEARAFKREGRRSQSQEKYRACIKVAEELTKRVMKRVEQQFEQQNMNAICIWAPYEADAQMVRLCMDGTADGIVTEDSDVLVYLAACNVSCPVLFKLDRQTGACDIISMDWLLNSSNTNTKPILDIQQNGKQGSKGNSRGLESTLKSMSFHQTNQPGRGARLFVQACVLAGCDYAPNLLKGIGPVRAFKQVIELADRPPDTLFEAILFELPSTVTQGIENLAQYAENLAQSEAVFYYHLVVDNNKACTTLIPRSNANGPNHANKFHPDLAGFKGGLTFLGSEEFLKFPFLTCSSKLRVKSVPTVAAPAGDAVQDNASTMDRRLIDHRQANPDDKRIIFFAIRSAMVNGHLKGDFFTELAKQLRLEPLTVSRQWHRMEKSLRILQKKHPEEDHEQIIRDNHHKLFGTKHNMHRQGKFKHDRKELHGGIRAKEFKAGRNRRQLAGQPNLSLTTVDGHLRERTVIKGPKLLYGGTILKVHSSSLKPTLTEGKQEHRFLYAIDQLKPGALDQMSRVHVDEKWFYLIQDGGTYRLVVDEPAPHPTTKHKNYIDKVMFLCAQARPRQDYTTGLWWDGKIGIWAVGHWEKAKRANASRPRGAPVWKNDSMNKVRYTEMMLDLVIPAILEKWPVGELANPSIKIMIQQDNAPAHPKVDDPYILGEVAKLWDPHYWCGEDGEDQQPVLSPGKIGFYAQPPNSPDTNILDLGLFNAIQTAYCTYTPKNRGDIIKMVEQTYNDYPWQEVDRLFVTLQSVLVSIIVAHDDNQDSITHMNNAKMEREGTLPRELAASQGAIDIVKEWNEQIDLAGRNNEGMVTAPGGLPAIGVGAPFVDDGDSSVASFGSEGDRIIEELEADAI